MAVDLASGVVATTASNVGTVLSLGSVTVVGTLLGASMEALILASIAAFLVLSTQDTTNRLRAISLSLFGVLLAGYVSPYLAAYLSSMSPIWGAAGPVMLRNVCAIAIGGGWQYAVPVVWGPIKSIITTLILNMVPGARSSTNTTDSGDTK